MDKEEVVYIHIYSGILLSHQQCNLNICNDMDGIRGYYGKQNKSMRDNYHMILLMWNLRNKTEDRRGREGKK